MVQIHPPQPSLSGASRVPFWERTRERFLLVASRRPIHGFHSIAPKLRPTPDPPLQIPAVTVEDRSPKGNGERTCRRAAVLETESRSSLRDNNGPEPLAMRRPVAHYGTHAAAASLRPSGEAILGSSTSAPQKTPPQGSCFFDFQQDTRLDAKFRPGLPHFAGPLGWRVLVRVAVVVIIMPPRTFQRGVISKWPIRGSA